MPAEKPVPSSPAPPRSAHRWPWWKRLLAGVGVLLLVLVLFYQPIIVLAVKLLAPGLAAKQGLKLNRFGLGGTIFTSLRIDDLHVTPTRPGPFEKIDVGHLELHYSLLTFARHGLNSDFIKSAALHDVEFIYDPSKSPPSPPKKKEPFSLPPLPLPDQLELRHVTFLMRPDTPEGARAAGQAAAASSVVPVPVAPVVAGATTAVGEQGLLVKDANLELDPTQNGQLRIAELRIPGISDLTNIQGQTSYRNRDLQLTDLRLSPDIFFHQLIIDGSKLDQQLLTLSLDADLFQGRANATISTEGISKPPHAQVQLDLTHIVLASVRDFLQLSLPLEGTLANFSVRFDGVTDQPQTWTGRVDSRLDHPNAGGTPLDDVTLRATLNKGVVQIDNVGVAAGDNKVALAAKIFLASEMAKLPQSTGNGTLSVTVPDFTKLPVKLPQEVAGALTANGDFGLAGGKFTTNLKGHVQSLAIPAQKIGVEGIDFAVESGKVLPADATAAPTAPGAPPPPHLPFYDRLQTHAEIDASGVRYADYAIDSVKLVAGSDNAAVKLDTVEILRGRNSVHLSGTYQIPDDNSQALQQPIDLHLNVDVPNLNGFAVNPDNPPLPLTGQLTAKADVQSRRGVYGGAINLQATNVQAKGATVQSADVQIAIADSHATVQKGLIVLDDKNYVDLSGAGDLRAPYPFNAGLTVDLADLSRLNPVLAANGVNQGLAGSVKISGTAHGHAATTPDTKDQQLDGSVVVTARDLLAPKGLKVQGADLRVDVANNRATIQTGEIRLDDKTGLKFGGFANLGSPRTFDLNLSGDVPDLAVFSPLLQSGDTVEKVAGSIHLAAHANGQLATLPDGSDQRIEGGLDLTANNLQAEGQTIQAVTAQIVAANDVATIQTLQVKVDDRNTVNVSGHAGLKPPYAYDAALDISLQDLKSLLPAVRTPERRQEHKAARIEAAAKAGAPPIHQVNGPDVRHPDETHNLVTKTGTAAGPVTVEVKGAPDEPGTASYVAPVPPKLGGSVELHWKAQGDFAAPAQGGTHYSGGGTLAAHQVVFNTVGPLEADIQGRYAQQFIDFPVIVVDSNGLEFRTTVQLKDALARIDKISLKQGTLELLAGYVQIPLDLSQLSAPGGPIPDVDKIDVNVASKPLAIETLLRSADNTAKDTSPWRGTLQLQLDAHGSLSKIVAEARFAARGLRSTQLRTLKPVDADLGIFLKDNRLSLDTSVRQSQINPLTIKGYLPVDLHQIAHDRAIDPNSPVYLTLNLPRTDLGFLAGATKAIRFIQGTAAADVRVGGTVGKPSFSGSAELLLPAVRADNITVPAIRDFAARLNFTNTQLRIERLAGEIGGGKLNVDGGATFVKLSEPVLNLHATARNVLAVRDDNLTARVNADVRVTGPLASADVTGSVGITKTRYLKDIDILPLNTPGKPAPQPPSPSDSSAPASIGVYAPPVSNWKLHLDIRTDDPIFIRGNLANGTVLVDLHLRGTGAQPLLDGNVNVQNLTASLPFSTLTISDGNVLFTPDQPLNPVLNLNGTSEIRNYLVTVFITGRAHDPKITFSSDPPLAKEQIVSLLATGATTDELAGDSTALAGKATLLLLQDLYRQTFKKRTSARAEPRSTLGDKVSLSLGSTDPNTGRQQVGATFKITPTLQFIANLGIEGDLQGRLKYLIRFR